MCAQWRLRSAGQRPSLIRVFPIRMKKPWVLSFPLSTSEDSDQTAQICRLIWVFAGCTGHFVGFVMLRLKCKCSPSFLLVFDCLLSVLDWASVGTWPLPCDDCLFVWAKMGTSPISFASIPILTIWLEGSWGLNKSFTIPANIAK